MFDASNKTTNIRLQNLIISGKQMSNLVNLMKNEQAYINIDTPHNVKFADRYTSANDTTNRMTDNKY